MDADDGIRVWKVQKKCSESVKEMFEEVEQRFLQSNAGASFVKHKGWYDSLSDGAKLELQSWCDESVLASGGRDVRGPDGAFRVHSEDKYMDMIKEMVDRVAASGANREKLLDHGPCGSVERNSLCALHPYGRVVLYCECKRPLGRMLPKRHDRVGRCSCLPVPPMSSTFQRHDHVVYCFAPHSVKRATGLCEGVRGLSGDLVELSENMEMFARLTRYLFQYAGSRYIVREVLGGPFTGYMQATVMLALRLSVSDTLRVVSERKLSFMRDDVIQDTVLAHLHFLQMMARLRSQGFYRGWMNNIVQNAKLVAAGMEPISDADYRERFVRAGQYVPFADTFERVVSVGPLLAKPEVGTSKASELNVGAGSVGLSAASVPEVIASRTRELNVEVDSSVVPAVQSTHSWFVDPVVTTTAVVGDAAVVRAASKPHVTSSEFARMRSAVLTSSSDSELSDCDKVIREARLRFEAAKAANPDSRNEGLSFDDRLYNATPAEVSAFGLLNSMIGRKREVLESRSRSKIRVKPKASVWSKFTGYT